MVVFAWRNAESHIQWLAGILLPANLLSRTDTRMDALLWGCFAAIYFPTIARYGARIHFSQLWLPLLATLLVIENLRPPRADLIAGGSPSAIEIFVTRLGHRISASPLALPRAVESSPAHF